MHTAIDDRQTMNGCHFETLYGTHDFINFPAKPEYFYIVAGKDRNRNKLRPQRRRPDVQFLFLCFSSYFSRNRITHCSYHRNPLRDFSAPGNNRNGLIIRFVPISMCHFRSPMSQSLLTSTDSFFGGHMYFARPLN